MRLTVTWVRVMRFFSLDDSIACECKIDGTMSTVWDVTWEVYTSIEMVLYFKVIFSIVYPLIEKNELILRLQYSSSSAKCCCYMR